MRRLVQAAGAFVLLAAATQAPAAETVTFISVGSSSANSWPSYVAVEKGFFGAAEIDPDIVYALSNANAVQQVAAGSAQVSQNSGLVDPIRAIQQGAPLALIRLEVRAPPYSLLAKPAIKEIKELKGKLISVGGAKDITRIFTEQILTPNGVKPGEFDMTFAGATSARFAALQAGAVDAAILTPPYNFRAQSAGFRLLAHAAEYSDMPFAGMSVNTDWAQAHSDIVRKIIGVYNRSIAWLYDPANRKEAVQILMRVSKTNEADVEQAYDFLIGGKYYEPTGEISIGRLNKLVDALKRLGDIPQDFSTQRLFLPGVTEISN